MPKDNAPAPFELPSDLTTLTPEELAALSEAARAEVNPLIENPAAENLARATQLADALDALTAEDTRRTEEQAKNQADFDAIAARLNPPAAADDTAADATDTAPADADSANAAPVAVAASARPTSSTQTAPRELGGLGRQNQINPSLGAARTVAPTVQAPKSELIITASAGSADGRFAPGAKLPDVKSLAQLLEERARSLPVTASGAVVNGRRVRRDADPYGGMNVARITHAYDDVLHEGSSVEAVEQYRNKLQRMRRPNQMETLVAAGGWCAPSEIRYDFFNIACGGSGMLDLPTFGVQRGGLRWPVSPSLADSYTPDLSPFEAAPSVLTVPWLWTETDDIAAATGSPIKPCIRVPCSTMSEARLECFGVCVTAGNLADNAWPESTANFLRLLDVAFDHTKNYRYINSIRTLTTNGGTISCTGTGAASPLLDAVELAAVDYRKRYVMCWDDVIEVVLPEWAVSVIRADVGKRTGVDLLGVTDAQIMAWFNARNIRLQLVDDYQVRTTGTPGYSTIQTSWPDTVEFMLWAPGTFGLGNGMTLDLGVVRDSTLNETNDHTAAWYEQCHMIAQFGHAGRRYTVPLCPSGVTGAANITACCP